MTILAKTLLTLVRRHLMALVLLSVWHNYNVLRFKFHYFTSLAKLFEGLNAGMLCSGIVIVVFFEMLRATLVARFLMMKLPKPRK